MWLKVVLPSHAVKSQTSSLGEERFMTGKGHWGAGNSLFLDLGCWLHRCYLVSKN